MKAGTRPQGYGDHLVLFLAQGFGAGRLPVAPGTFGTLVAVPFYLLLPPLTWWGYLALVLALFVLGVWLCQQAQEMLGQHDHPGIVWDEIVGYLVTMWLAPTGWFWVALGFGLFRLFDIWKPFPIRSLERWVPGGLGIMLDDVLAGLYACLVLQVIYGSGVSL
jgi:phosphatidylglycerophosphatase A